MRRLKTAEELEKGWIWDANGESLDGKVIARRFGLQQGDKLRVIDDCSCGGLNHSVGLAERFQLHTYIDQLASMLAHSFSMAGEGAHPRVMGRTYDLRAAYKQFPVSLADREILRTAVCRPGCGGRICYIAVHCLVNFCFVFWGLTSRTPGRKLCHSVATSKCWALL